MTVTAPLRGAPVLERVPPPGVPLGFLGAAGVGLVGFGLALPLVASRAVEAPTSSPVVATVHLAMLAFLSTAALGALHQFTPVVGGRPLRSNRLAWGTLAVFVAAAWGLPIGFATDTAWLVSGAGALAVASIAAAAWNVSGPLGAPDRSAPMVGLRWSVGFLVATALMGGLYALDRQAGWFGLLPNRVLAHAHLGLLGWLGLTYVAVAEKLWPMFLLAHRPGPGPGRWAVRLLPAGVLLLVPGLLSSTRAFVVAGAALAGAGFAAHLLSLGGYVRARRRPLALLHAFILSGAALLVVAAGLGVAAGLAPVAPATRVRLVSAEVAALAGWLALAVVGHAHKIVPFISWTALRSRGIQQLHEGGPQLLFADLYDARVARATYATAATAAPALVAGLVTGAPVLVGASGVLFAITGALALANLGLGPTRVARATRRGVPLTPRCHQPAWSHS
ncbi:MAG: hypothetical protein HYU28_11430 [Actinobacteria bacterium]|nr:hypothetical protein [Actinomycetota bacterium]